MEDKNCFIGFSKDKKRVDRFPLDLHFSHKHLPQVKNWVYEVRIINLCQSKYLSCTSYILILKNWRENNINAHLFVCLLHFWRSGVKQVTERAQSVCYANRI